MTPEQLILEAIESVKNAKNFIAKSRELLYSEPVCEARDLKLDYLNRAISSAGKMIYFLNLALEAVRGLENEWGQIIKSGFFDDFRP